MTNRLAESLSPYLRQHADNPVHWREWGPDAFEEARRRDVPVLLSVGYAACHWCHVMAHESFENTAVAEALNAGYVAVKVDREERPDVDAVYMGVTQALTGQGGWPMTVVLTPDAAPIFAGTYFPREHFLQVLASISQVWREDRTRAEETGRTIVTAMQGVQGRTGGALLDDAALTAAVRQLRGEFDLARGGFGGAPKFPPSMTLEHLLRHHARTGDTDALAMVTRTAEAMARGGLYDQLEGGFARYSVDAGWVVPHFEKMLYDNAQLLRVYTHLWRVTGDELAARVVRETAWFLLARLRTDEGAFASALDADTNGVEGLTYAWTPAQLVDVLGPDDGARAARLLCVTAEGTFEDGVSTLQLLRDPDDAFTREELSAEPAQWWKRVREQLAASRAQRPQPARDHKVVTAWNGLAVAALAEAAMTFEEPAWTAAALEAAEFLWREHRSDEAGGRLLRTSLGGRVSAALAGADDHGALAEALLVLHQTTGDAVWLERGLDLLDRAEALFVEMGGEGTDGPAAAQVYDSGIDAERLFVRPRSSGDNAEPSGASALASAFAMAFALSGDVRYRSLASVCLAQLGDAVSASPRFAGWALATAEALAVGPLQVAVVTPAGADDGEVDAWRRVLARASSPGLVSVIGRPDAPGVPLLADRSLVNGAATAYVCRGFICDAPITSVEALKV